MKILLLSATAFELKATLNWIEKNTGPSLVKNQITTLQTGLGATLTAFELTRFLCQNPDTHTVIHAGIAGAYDSELSIGQLVELQNDQFTDLAFQDTNGDHSFVGGGNVSANEFPFSNGRIDSKHQFADNELILGLPKVSGSTVNTVLGRNETIAENRKKYDTQIETMEGIAALYVCRKMNVNILSIRAISNYVEQRNLQNWNIQLAVGNLNDFLINLIQKL